MAKYINKKDLSYFKLRLKEHFIISFPERADDDKFIDRRAALAANAYDGAFTSGNRVEECNEIADFILFEGLHFSKFDTVFSVICNEFDTIMADEDLRPFALSVMSICEETFTNHEFTNDFSYTQDFDLLYTELTGVIALWIEENGLQ